MKNIIVYLTLVLAPISSWAKIITKEEVKTRFIEMVNRDMQQKCIDENCLDVYSSYALIPSSVEISLPDSPGTWLEELEYGADHYEVHADFYKVETAEDQQGKIHKFFDDKFHYNGTLKVYSEGVTSKNTYQYSMRVVESEFYSYNASESDDPLEFGNTYRWTVNKSYY